MISTNRSDHKGLNYELIRDYNDWKVLRTSCDCLSNDHLMSLDFEYDRETNQVILEFNYEVTPNVQLNNDFSGFFRKWKERLKFICKILFDKPIQYEESFIFRGKEHLDELNDAIEYFSDKVFHNNVK